MDIKIEVTAPRAVCMVPVKAEEKQCKHPDVILCLPSPADLATQRTP